MNLRQKVNEDLQQSMEGLEEWGLPVELIAPDGTIYDLKKDTQEKLTGQVLFNRVEFNPDTGEEYTIDDPLVTLRIASLPLVPAPGETWLVRIPESPDPNGALVTYSLTPTKAAKFNRSLGYVILYLQKVEQSE